MDNDFNILTTVEEPAVGQLPVGTLVGDQFGGRSFNDNVAAALEQRSTGGWRDVQHGESNWTLIRIEK